MKSFFLKEIFNFIFEATNLERCFLIGLSNAIFTQGKAFDHHHIIFQSFFVILVASIQVAPSQNSHVRESRRSIILG